MSNIKLLRELTNTHFNNLNNIVESKQHTNNEKINRDCNNIVLHYNSNSCYFDSLMVALFHTNNPIIKDIIFNNINNIKISSLKKKSEEIKEELLNIYNLIGNTLENKSSYTCTNIRKLLNEYEILKKKEYPDYNNIDKTNWENSQAESFQLLQFLNNIIGFKDTSIYDYLYWGTNNNLTKIELENIIKTQAISKSENINLSFIDNIEVTELLDKSNIKIKDYYPIRTNIKYLDDKNLWSLNGKTYNIIIEQIKLVKAPVLFIHIDRKSKDKKINTKIILEKEIKLSTNKILELYSIIIHKGSHLSGHYICLFNCNDLWYEYDDLGPTITKIGTFNNLISNDYYLNNCTDLLYIEKLE